MLQFGMLPKAYLQPGLSFLAEKEYQILKKKFELCVFFPPDPTPFPGSGVLCSNHFYQNIHFVTYAYLF